MLNHILVRKTPNMQKLFEALSGRSRLRHTRERVQAPAA